jgi:hypothetical protein
VSPLATGLNEWVPVTLVILPITKYMQEFKQKEEQYRAQAQETACKRQIFCLPATAPVCGLVWS